MCVKVNVKDINFIFVHMSQNVPFHIFQFLCNKLKSSSSSVLGVTLAPSQVFANSGYPHVPTVTLAPNKGPESKSTRTDC